MVHSTVPRVLGYMVFLSMALLILPLEAQSPPNEPAALDAAAAILFISREGYAEQEDPEIRRSIDYVAQATENAFSPVGITIRQNQVTDDNLEGISPEQIQVACREAGVRWGITVYTRFSEERLSWRISIYDGAEGFFRASDAFVVSLYVGLSSQTPTESSANTVVQNWQKSFPDQRFDGNFAVSHGQRFSSPQHGIGIYFGSETGIFGGTIEEGELTTPIVLFVEGAPVYGVAVKQGYWSKPFSLPKGITDEVVPLPVLQKKTRHALSFITEFRGIEYYSVDFEYRFHVLRDRFFLKLDWAFWRDESPLSGLERLLHQEVRFSPGLYIQLKKDFPVRIAVGTGVSLAFAGGNINILTDPLWVDLEYHFSQWAVKAEMRVPKVFAYNRGIFGEDKVDSGLYVSFGIMLKW